MPSYIPIPKKIDIRFIRYFIGFYDIVIVLKRVTFAYTAYHVHVAELKETAQVPPYQHILRIRLFALQLCSRSYSTADSGNM